MIASFRRGWKVAVLLALLAPRVWAGSAAELVPPDFAEIPTSLFFQGVREAEQLRCALLERSGSSTPAARTAHAIRQFLEQLPPAFRQRFSADAFPMTDETFLNAIRGVEGPLDPVTLFSGFNGLWYGQWDEMPVDHDWRTPQSCHPPLPIDGPGAVRVHGFQFAWVGDGFGWNVVASSREQPQRRFILGSVYHVVDGDPKRVRLHRPHVGISVGRDRLIWLTRKEVFLEERLPEGGGLPERYVITGFRYQDREGVLTHQGRAFQAVYTRSPDQRPAWRACSISLHVK